MDAEIEKLSRAKGKQPMRQARVSSSAKNFFGDSRAKKLSGKDIEIPIDDRASEASKKDRSSQPLIETKNSAAH